MQFRQGKLQERIRSSWLEVNAEEPDVGWPIYNVVLTPKAHPATLGRDSIAFGFPRPMPPEIIAEVKYQVRYRHGEYFKARIWCTTANVIQIVYIVAKRMGGYIADISHTET
jgi:hypothetical protein